jgi:hypothetical protein
MMFKKIKKAKPSSSDKALRREQFIKDEWTLLDSKEKGKMTFEAFRAIRLSEEAEKEGR